MARQLTIPLCIGALLLGGVIGFLLPHSEPPAFTCQSLGPPAVGLSKSTVIDSYWIVADNKGDLVQKNRVDATRGTLEEKFTVECTRVSIVNVGK